jgi:hypothetical protein
MIENESIRLCVPKRVQLQMAYIAKEGWMLASLLDKIKHRSTEEGFCEMTA